jgi:methionine biosynthesis protein MetW
MSNYSDSAFDQSNKNTSWYKVFTLIDECSTVLDIGCSSGNFGKELIDRKKCTVDGVEINKEDVLEATSKLRKVYSINIETDNLSIISDKYDYVYFGDVIEHLIDPVNTLNRIKTLLKDNGSIIFSIPNMGYIAIRLELMMGEFEYTETGLLDKTHLHYYTQKEVIRIFNDSGYEIKLMDYVKSGYTERFINTYLKKAGLKATQKFYKFCKTSEASAFQFVGIARISNTKHKKHKLKQYGPADNQGEFYEKIVKQQEKTIASINSAIEKLKEENAKLDKANSDIINSKRYKLANKVGTIVNLGSKNK